MTGLAAAPWLFLAAVWLAACAGPLAARSPDGAPASDASAVLGPAQARIITDNDTAFEAKLAAVRGARERIDLAYYIYADDHSSAVLTEALVEAARRGVRVRLLLDYFTNYRRLDLLSLIERESASARGRLDVRLYGRPTPWIIRDAVFVTLGCGTVVPDASLRGCGAAKYEHIERLLAEEGASGPRAVSNFNSGGSGVFLSGLYGKNVGLMALAIKEGQGLSPSGGGGGAADRERRPISPEAIDRALEFGPVLWRARFGDAPLYQRLVATLKVELAFALYGEKLDSLYDALTAYLPLERRESSGVARRDWEYLTAFLHHKLLLVDGRTLILGGRNVEDSYHMAPSPLVRRYLFRDTDLQVELAAEDPGLTATFDALWEFSPMVARLDEVRRHAPNDVLMATERADAACGHLDATRREAAHADCHTAALAAHLDLERRLALEADALRARAEAYRREYRPAPAAERSPDFAVDAGARLSYLENLHFDRRRPPAERVRTYGTVPGRDAETGKAIHPAWRRALRDVCRAATPENPQRVLYHSAYFLPPADLLRDLGGLGDGTLGCPHLEATIVTNSAATTDLHVINLVARHVVRAFAAHHRRHRNPERGAALRYFEYRADPATGRAERSLHSKVMVFGPDVFVGSANADVRSYVLDTNNGVLIRGAPRLAAAYAAWVERLVADGNLVEDRTAWFLDSARMATAGEDQARIVAVLREVTAGTDLDRRVPLGHVAARLTGLLDRAHTLASRTLEGGLLGLGAPERFDRLFKVL